MFTKQVELMNGLRGLPMEEAFQKLLDLLPSMVGNCSQPIEHRGEVGIEVDGLTLGAPEIPFTEVNNVFAGLNVRNPGSIFLLDETTIQNGVAAFFEGVMVVHPAPTQNNPTGESVCLVVNGGTYSPQFYTEEIHDTTNNYTITINSTTVTYSGDLVVEGDVTYGTLAGLTFT